LQLVKKFPAFHGTRRFITALTSVRHLSLSWASPIQSTCTIIIIIIIFVVIGSTALGGPWPPQANVATDLSPVQPPANFYNLVSLRLPPPRQSILISVGHVLGDLHGLFAHCTNKSNILMLSQFTAIFSRLSVKSNSDIRDLVTQDAPPIRFLSFLTHDGWACDRKKNEHDFMTIWIVKFGRCLL